MGRASRRSGLSFLQFSVVAAVLLPTLVPQAAVTASGSSRKNASSKVRVTVFFESLCIDSIRLFADQLPQTYNRLKDIMELEFVPFGKAVARKRRNGNYVRYEFKCQHGPPECFGNCIMGCAQSLLPSDNQYQLFSCMMKARNPATAGPKCSEALGLDWSTIASCSNSRGPELLFMNGKKTAAIMPRLNTVPTIAINGNYHNNIHNEPWTSLQTLVCKAHGAPHPACTD